MYSFVKVSLLIKFYKKNKLFKYTSSDGLEIDLLNQNIKHIEYGNLYPANKKLIKKRMIEYIGNNWKSPIKYKIEEGLDSKKIKVAIKRIEEKTCLKFNEDQTLSDTEQGIKFVKGNECGSALGKQNGNVNFINLTHYCSTILGVVQHEIGHALGLIHEHQREDRDDYVSIQKANIIDEHRKQIEDVEASATFNSLGIIYEYGSAMHYEIRGFSKNGQPTIVVKNIDAYNKMLGQNDGFTFADYKLLNLKHCSETCLDKRKCLNGGYLYSKSCFNCECPKGYDGEKCEFYKPLPGNCKKSSLTAQSNPQLLHAEGIRECNFNIKSENGTKIVLILHESNTYNRTICASNYGLEIKYFKDKGLTGLCLCGLYKNINITSEENDVYIEYHGSMEHHY
uniref:Metalloendopeptidase n=1 Tax=Parastrongyloides trichosuri TaxID=131310 RepID=A0A0N4ZKX5_PARTI